MVGCPLAYFKAYLVHTRYENTWGVMVEVFENMSAD